MAARSVGYEFLRKTLALPAFGAPPFAQVESVTKVIPWGEEILAIPANVAPAGDASLGHLLFALKHEPLNLQTAVMALQRIPAEDVHDAFRATPSGQYVRLAGYLWELANGRQLPATPAAAGPYVPVFDPAYFLTGTKQRSTRWRVDFNGLGPTPEFCPVVRRNPAIKSLLAAGILDQVQAFLRSVPKSILDRAVQWAYLSETDSSYGIERETAPADKRQAFAALLSHAHEAEPLTEDYLVSLQNAAVTNPRDRAFSFRTTQNWLRNGRRVTYLPPPPDLAATLMDQIMQMANQPDPAVDPLVRAAMVSFAFVFVHPFLDGNGRLSRFLFHKVACRDPRLSHGLVLPVSIAMKRHEDQYLQALESFSKPARTHWDVTDIDGSVQATFNGVPEMYRYWDATACVEFSLRMAREALDHDLRAESAFLFRFDRVYKAVDAAVDMNGNDLFLLVRSVVTNGGHLSNHRRKQFLEKGHPAALVDHATAIAGETYVAAMAETPAPPAQIG